MLHLLFLTDLMIVHFCYFLCKHSISRFMPSVHLIVDSAVNFWTELTCCFPPTYYTHHWIWPHNSHKLWDKVYYRLTEWSWKFVNEPYKKMSYTKTNSQLIDCAFRLLKKYQSGFPKSELWSQDPSLPIDLRPYNTFGKRPPGWE